MLAPSESSPRRDLPGGALIAQGFTDLNRGVVSVPALLVEIGAPRLRQLTLDLPNFPENETAPEHRLYALLARQHGDATHSRYNALIRLLVSFTRAAVCVS